MPRIIIKYETESEKLEYLELISKGSKQIKKISKPYRKGKFFRIYIDFE